MSSQRWGRMEPASGGGGGNPGTTSNPVPQGTQPYTPNPVNGDAKLDPDYRKKWGANLTPLQSSSDTALNGTEVSAGCGPIAAIGTARAYGLNPDIQQT